MSIRAEVLELNEIDQELKILTLKRKKLNERKNLLKERISSFLKEKDQQGLKLGDKAYILKEEEKFKRKNKEQIQKDALKILEDHGIKNSQQILNEILSCQKGQAELKEKLKIEKIK